MRATDQFDHQVAILAKIPGLQWHHNRGYFEWSHGSSDAGFVEPPCDSEGFPRLRIAKLINCERLLAELSQRYGFEEWTPH